MCNQAVKQQIVERLCALGSVCSESASNRELRLQLGFDTSNNVFKRALGSAIKDEMIIRHRPAPTSLCDDQRPVTLVPGPAAGKVLLLQRAQPQPYFVS